MPTLKDLIQKLMSESKSFPMICLVKAVAGNDVVLEPLNGTASFEARIQADELDGIKVVPAVDSIVIANFAENGDAPYIALYSKVKEIEVVVDDKIKIANQNLNLGKILVDLCAALEILTVTTPMGPSGTPVNVAQITAVKNQLQTLLKTI